MKAFFRVLAGITFLHSASIFRGSQALQMAETVVDLLDVGYSDPFSLEIREAQIESLYTFFKDRPERVQHLEEAAFIARDLKRRYPGSAQATAILAVTEVMARVHGGNNRARARLAAEEAFQRDPMSVANMETLMFLLTAERSDNQRFKYVGIQRAKLINRGLVMRCPLCGKGWLEHRAKEALGPSPGFSASNPE